MGSRSDLLDAGHGGAFSKPMIKLYKGQSAFYYHHVLANLNNVSDKNAPPFWGGPLSSLLDTPPLVSYFKISLELESVGMV